MNNSTYPSKLQILLASNYSSNSIERFIIEDFLKTGNSRDTLTTEEVFRYALEDYLTFRGEDSTVAWRYRRSDLRDVKAWHRTRRQITQMFRKYHNLPKAENIGNGTLIFSGIVHVYEERKMSLEEEIAAVTEEFETIITSEEIAERMKADTIYNAYMIKNHNEYERIYKMEDGLSSESYLDVIENLSDDTHIQGDDDVST